MEQKTNHQNTPIVYPSEFQKEDFLRILPSLAGTNQVITIGTLENPTTTLYFTGNEVHLIRYIEHWEFGTALAKFTLNFEDFIRYFKMSKGPHIFRTLPSMLFKWIKTQRSASERHDHEPIPSIYRRLGMQNAPRNWYDFGQNQTEV